MRDRQPEQWESSAPRASRASTARGASSRCECLALSGSPVGVRDYDEVVVGFEAAPQTAHVLAERLG